MATFRELFGPNERYPYFDLADRFPFEATGHEYSPVNASWLADAALLAYLPSEKAVLERLGHAGLEGRCVGFGGPGVQCFVARAEAWALVSFCGTKLGDLVDLRTDLGFILESRDGYPGRIHRGFAQALDQIWPEVEAELPDPDPAGASPPVWFTGHSLGAALATLAAARYPARATYAFGSPRVGNADFCQGVRSPVYRVVNNCDGVTGLPTGAPVGGYRHVGIEVFLDQDGCLVDSPTARDRLAARVKGHAQALRGLAHSDLADVNAPALRDHSPTIYAEHLRSAVAGPGLTFDGGDIS